MDGSSSGKVLGPAVELSRTEELEACSPVVRGSLADAALGRLERASVLGETGLDREVDFTALLVGLLRPAVVGLLRPAAVVGLRAFPPVVGVLDSFLRLAAGGSSAEFVGVSRPLRREGGFSPFSRVVVPPGAPRALRGEAEAAAAGDSAAGGEGSAREGQNEENMITAGGGPITDRWRTDRAASDHRSLRVEDRDRPPRV